MQPVFVHMLQKKEKKGTIHVKGNEQVDVTGSYLLLLFRRFLLFFFFVFLSLSLSLSFSELLGCPVVLNTQLDTPVVSWFPFRPYPGRRPRCLCHQRCGGHGEDARPVDRGGAPHRWRRSDDLGAKGGRCGARSGARFGRGGGRQAVWDGMMQEDEDGL